MRILVFLISLSIQSQTVLLKGKLLDASTNQPIVYANISFLKGDKGISSQENGVFSLEIEENELKEKIHISCLNYKDTVVFAKDLQNKTLFLNSKNVELEEVVLSKKVDREFIVDKLKRRDIKSSFGGIQSSPWIITKFFDFKDKYVETPYLKEITVYFGSLLGRRKSKFRIRLFKVDTLHNKPLSEDLTNKEIIAYSRKIDGKVKIDISKLDIEFPKKGFFVGLERIHIPYNFYEYTYTKQGKRKKYIAKAIAPNFGAVYTKDTLNIFLRGKWKKYYFSQDFYKGNTIQPAISVTLSN